jgi:hypothetical protein
VASKKADIDVEIEELTNQLDIANLKLELQEPEWKEAKEAINHCGGLTAFTGTSIGDGQGLEEVDNGEIFGDSSIGPKLLEVMKVSKRKEVAML